MVKSKIGMIIKNKDKIVLDSDILEFEGKVIGIDYKSYGFNIQIEILKANLPNYVGEKFWFDETEIVEVYS